MGVLAALFQRQSNGGNGQIIDVSMTEGLAYLGSFVNAYKHVEPMWNDEYAYFSGHCPIYRTYETADGKWMAVGALEARFHRELFKKLGLHSLTPVDVLEEPKRVVDELERVFKSATRQHWTELFASSDACVTPVLELDEVGHDQHHRTRQAFTRDPDTDQWMPVPAPRFFSAKAFDEHRREQQGTTNKGDKSKL